MNLIYGYMIAHMLIHDTYYCQIIDYICVNKYIKAYACVTYI